MAKIQIKSEKLTPFGGIFSGNGATQGLVNHNTWTYDS